MNLRFPIRHARNPLAGIQRTADGFPPHAFAGAGFEDCGNDRTREFMDTFDELVCYGDIAPERAARYLRAPAVRAVA